MGEGRDGKLRGWGMSVADNDLCRSGSPDCPARPAIMPRQKSEHALKAHSLRFREEKKPPERGGGGGMCVERLF